MKLTHRQMVEEALSEEQAPRKYDDSALTNADIQAYIYMNFSEQITTGEISDIRQAAQEALTAGADEEAGIEKALAELNNVPAYVERYKPAFWYQSVSVDPWTDPYWH